MIVNDLGHADTQKYSMIMPTHEIFTPDAINHLTPQKRQEIHSARSHPGLQLILSRNQAGLRRSFAVTYSLHGQTQRIKLRDLTDSVTHEDLSAAFVEACEIRRAVGRGEDPRASRRATAALTSQKDLTLKDAWVRYSQSDSYRRLRPASQRTYASVWDCSLGPVLGRARVGDIKLEDLIDAHKKIDQGGSRKGMARMSMIIFGNIWKYMDRYELLPANVRPPHKYLASELGQAMNSGVRRNDIPDDKLADFWALTYEMDLEDAGNPVGQFGPAIRFALNTGLRSSELRGLRWTDINLEQGTLFLPAARMKSKRDFLIPLNTLAMAELHWLAYGEEEHDGLATTFVFGRNSASMMRAIAEAIGKVPTVVRRKPRNLASDLPLGDPRPRIRSLGKQVVCPEDLTTHSLRKTFARHLESASDFLTTKRLLGHADHDVTANYIRPDLERLRLGAEALADRYRELLGDELRTNTPMTTRYLHHVGET